MKRLLFTMLVLALTVGTLFGQVSTVSWTKKAGEDTTRLASLNYGALVNFLTFPNGAVFKSSGGLAQWLYGGTMDTLATRAYVRSTAQSIGGLSFVTKVPEADLTNEFALSSLATGILKNTTGTGIPTIAIAGTDYESPLTFTSPLSRSVNAISLGGLSSIGTANTVVGVNSGATAWEYKALSTGTAGTDFAIAHSAGGITFNLPSASATTRGALTAADWTTFNNKQPAGNYITALTGDVTATGPGSVPATITAQNSAFWAGKITDETGTNKVVFSDNPTITGGTHTAITSFGIRSTGTGAFDLKIASSENFTSDKTLTITLNDANRTLTIAGNSTISGTNTGDVTLAGENYLSITGQAITANAINLGTTNVTGTLGETKGGTGESAYVVGDLLYSDAANSLARLAGNTTTTKKFLSQTGTGTASAAPVWDVLTDADVPNTITLDNLTQVTTRNHSDLTGLTITTSGHTMNTARLLGRTTASAGAIEEISAGTGLSLSGGSLSVSDNTTTQKVEVVKNSGAVVSTRKQLNFIEGSNVTLTIADDAANDQVDITIASSGGASGYAMVQEEGTSLTQRSVLNFIGSGVTAADDAGNSRTNVSLHAQLNSLADLASNGLVARTAANTLTARTITGTTNRITVANGDGVSGNPTLDIGSDVVTLTGTQTLTNKTLTAPTINGGTHTGITSFGIRSTGTGAFDLKLANTENLTAERTLTIAVNDANRTLTLSGNATLSGTNTGDVTLTGQNYLTLTGQQITAGQIDLGSTHVTGTLAAARFGALTGDVTSAGGTYATTIANDSVTFAKMQNIAQNRIIGRVSAGVGDPEELTGTQVTGLLDVFTASAKGLVPASGGGTQKFLRADGTWANPTAGVDIKDDGSFITTALGIDFGTNLNVTNNTDGTVTVNSPSAVQRSFTLNEDLSAGDVVKVVDNSGAKVSKLGQNTLGWKRVFSTGTGTAVIKQLSPTRAVALSLDFSSSNQNLVLHLFEVSGNWLHHIGSWEASDYDPSKVISSTFGLAVLSSTKVLVAYSLNSGGSKCRVIDLTNDTPTFGTLTTFTTATSVPVQADATNTDAFVIAWGGASPSVIAGTVSGTTITLGTAVSFDSSTPQSLTIRKIDTNTAVVTWGLSTSGMARVVSISGTTITLGSIATFNPANTNSVSLAVLATNKIAIGYSDLGNSSFVSVCVGDISGTTITFGSEFSSGVASGNVRVCELSSTSIIIAYEGSSPSLVKARQASISGTTVSFSSNIWLYDTPNLDSLWPRDAQSFYFIVAVSSGGFYTVRHKNAGIAIYSSDVIYWGNSIAYGDNNQVTATQSTAICALTSTKFVAAFFNSTTVFVRVVDISGETVTFGAISTIAISSTTRINLTRVSDTGFALILNSGANFTLYAATVSGTTITFGTAQTWSVTGTVNGVNVYLLSPNFVYALWELDDGAGTKSLNGRAYTVSGTTLTLSVSDFQIASSTIQGYFPVVKYDDFTILSAKENNLLVLRRSMNGQLTSIQNVRYLSSFPTNYSLYGIAKHNGGAVLFYKTNNSDIYATAFRVVGDAFVWGGRLPIYIKNTTQFITGNQSSLTQSPVYTLSNNRIVLALPGDIDPTYNNSVQLLFLRVEPPENLVFEDSFIFSATALLSFNAAKLQDGKLVFAYAPNIGSNVVPMLSFLFDERERTLGVMQASGTSGSSKAVTYRGGVSSVHSGLKIGERYYLREDGKIGTRQTAFPIGRAISSTELIVE